MKKIITFLFTLLSFGSIIVNAQNNYIVKRGERPPIDLKAIPEDAYEKGILKIKLVESFTDHLDNIPVGLNENGIVYFDINNIDQLNQQYGAKGFNKLFGNQDPSLKFSERHRAWGFHLWFTLFFDENTDIKELVRAYEQLPEVSIAEPLYKTKLMTSDPINFQIGGEGDEPKKPVGNTPPLPSAIDWTPNDPSYNVQWHYHNTGQQSGTVDADIDLPEAWNIETGNSNVIVSVHDMGVQYNHSDLNGNMWINSDEIAGNGIDDDLNGYVDDIYGYDFYNNNGSIEAGYHGTHVAGTVSAETNNGSGVAGVAGGSGSNDGVRIMTCMVYHPTNPGGVGHHLAPVYAADNGACIEQNSWGYTNPNSYDQAVLDAIDYFNINGGGDALSGGITIYAAGNSNSNGNYYPGCYSGTFAVAATNNQDIKAWYSNYGTWVDISAPGGETDVVTARGVYSTYTTSTYNYLQGTSMACPHASGVAALIISYAYGQLTAGEVADILRNTTDNHYGVNPGYIGQLGTGRLNAYQALLETENYLGYCAASGGCDEYISRVQFGTIDNVTGCTNYGNYTALSTNLGLIATQTLTVTNGTPSYPSDQCGVWIDWNKDEDFADANETITVSGTPGVGPYTASITPPSGTSAGTTRMRVRITYTGAVDPCGTTQYGEVEDYTINLIDYCAASGGCDEYISRVQFGTIDNNTGCSGYADYTAISTNLGLSATKTLTVTNGNLNYPSDQCGVWVDWNKDNDFYDANEAIAVSGTPGVGPYTASITPPAGTASGTVRMRIRITYTGSVDPCGANTYGEVEDYSINLLGPNYWVGGFNHYWHQAANWSAGHIPIEDEDVVINNTGYQPVYVDNYPGFPNEACYNLNIGTGASVQVWDMALNVNGNMVINGALAMTDATGVINVKQNWYNWVGTGGFTAGPGRVIFNGGAYHQYCMNETFNILEVNKPSGGAFRPINDHHIVCAAYDWTAGAVDVITGSFTANDLLDNGIFGAFYCNPGGTINLNNLAGNQWVDLNGELHIYGGTVNVTGNVSDWPYAGNAIIEMTDGVLDFKTCGININNTLSYTLTDNITGGVIRTALGFSGNRADFTPTAGTIELYSSSDAYISQSNGCTFHNVNINKSAKNASAGDPVLPISADRIDLTAGNGGKANIIYLSSNIFITNNLTISAGTLSIGPYTMNAAKTVDIYGGLEMTDAAGIFNVGTVAYDNMWFRNGSSANLSAGNINLNSWLAVDAGSSFLATTGNTIHVIGGNYSGGLGNSEPTAVFGNVEINKSVTSPTFFASDYTGPYNIAGNFTIQANNSFQAGTNAVHVTGFMTDQSTSSVYLYYADKDYYSLANISDTIGGFEMKSGSKGGSLIIDTDYTLNGLLDVNDGSALVHGIFHLASTGNLNITSGSFIADGPLFSKNWEYLDGYLGLTSGLFEITNNSIQFSATGTSTVSGGIIRSGEAFAAQYGGNFQPTGGTVEITGVGSNTIYCENGNYFYNLLINRDPAALSAIQTNIQVNNNLTVNSGTLFVGWSAYGYTASVLGGVTINGGVLSVKHSSNLLLGGSTTLNVNSGGKLSVIGVSGAPGRVSRIATGYYGLNINSGGAISAQYGTFEYMNTSGVNLLSGSIVDPVYSFHNCTFQNGQAAGRLMTVENNLTFNVENAVFPTNTWSGSYNVYKSVNAGTVNFVTATGGFAGESFDYDPNNRVNWTGRMLSLKAYLEGPFNGTTMNTTINGILPLSHPFNVTLPYFGGTPKWYYTGAGSVGAIPNVNIVDWVLLDIRDAANAAAATAATSVAKIPAFILNNGNIVALDGTSSPQVTNAIVNNLFVVIYSRNHEAIMNANLIPYSAGLYTYDYTTGAAQVIGGTAGHKELSPGKWGMRSGDGNGDGSVTTFDKTNVWGLPTQLGKTGYLPSDFSFDRQTNNKDKNDKWKPNLGTVSQVPN